MSGDAFGGLSGVAAAELHLKMSKKIAQLTKVIFHLNTRNEDFQMEFAHSSKVHATQLQQLTQDAAAKLRLLHEQLSMQTSAVQQVERQAAKDMQQFQKEFAQYQQKVQAKQSASEQSFQLKIANLEDQVTKCERAFSERMQQLVRMVEAQQHMSSLSTSAATDSLKSAHEREMDELRAKKNDEVTQLVTASNAKYNQMLAEQLRLQDALRDENGRAKALLEQQLQLTKHELSGELVAQEKAAKEAFDQMKNQLVGKIETLLADAERLRGYEAKLRQEKEALLQAQSDLQRQFKQLELQVTKAQHESQSVRKDADARAQSLQQMLTAGTDKIDQLAQELDALKKVLQTRDQALRQAQRDLEAAQMEMLQRNMSLSEKDAASHQQLQEKELQIANLKTEMQLASQQKASTETTLQKQIQALEAQLAASEKETNELKVRLTNSELERVQVQKEKEKALIDLKTENEAHAHAIQTLKQSQEKQLQELLASNSQALERQKNEMKAKLRDLETHLKQNTSESLEKSIAQLKSEHLKAQLDQKNEFNTAFAKVKQELVKAETQLKTLQGNVVGKDKELVDLRLKLVDLIAQLKKSQDLVTSLQLERDEKLKAVEKSRKEKEEALTKQIKELNSQKDGVVKKLSTERDQLQLQHSQILMALTKEYEAKQRKLQDEWEKDKQAQLASQTTQLSERYGLQVAALKSELSLLQAELERVKQGAQETQRAMHETCLYEKECYRSSISRHLDQLGAQTQCREDEGRLKMDTLLEQHVQELEALATRLNSEKQQLLSRTQKSAELRVTQLKATHGSEMEQQSQQHTLALTVLRDSLESARQRDLLVLRTENNQKLKELAAQKDQKRVEALQEAQGQHDTTFAMLQKQMELLQSALTQQTIDLHSSTSENERLNGALESKTREMTDRVASLERTNREQIEMLKKAAKQDMDRLLEENLAETKLLGDQFEETRRLMADKVVSLKQTVAEWEDRYARRESRPEDVSRIADLERLVAEKDALVRRTLDEMAYFKRELLNREEMYNKTFARTPNVGIMNVLKPHVQLQAQMQNGAAGAGLSLGNNNNSSSGAAPQTKRKTKPSSGAAPNGPEAQGGELHRRNSERTSSSSSGSGSGAGIATIADQKEKTVAYKVLLDKSIFEFQHLQEIVTHLLNENVLLVISRAVITHLATAIAQIDPDVHQWKLEFIIFCLTKLKTRILSFEEPDVLFRESLADLYMEEEEYIEAAKALAAINLESSARQYTDVQKAEKYVKIAELYLQEDETVDAENFINRASRFIHNVQDWTLKLRYQVSYARILDSKRKFLDAALRYYEFSQSKPDEVDPEDLLELLTKGVMCAILASAGPQRTRLLGTLYKDERVKNSEHFAILEKMYMEQLIRRPELVQFEKSLLAHQKAVLANGFTVLENSFLEHNLLAASRVYSCISLEELGKLLETDAESAERVAATMIFEERMKGSIDQQSGFLEFENADDEVLSAFDARISSICFNVNQCAEQIEQQFPQLVPVAATARP